MKFAQFLLEYESQDFELAYLSGDESVLGPYADWCDERGDVPRRGIDEEIIKADEVPPMIRKAFFWHIINNKARTNAYRSS